MLQFLNYFTQRCFNNLIIILALYLLCGKNAENLCKIYCYKFDKQTEKYFYYL